MKVGFIGLGNIGMPMAKVLHTAGFDLTVYNRSRGKVEEMASLGAKAASSVAEITETKDILLTCLPDVPTVEEVFLGNDGIVANAYSGQILVDHSTVEPALSQRIAEAARLKGAQFLDAPVSGLAERAAQGNLSIMVGGDQPAYEEALPLFQAMGSNVAHVGESGMGNVFKLVNNAVAITNVAVAAEGFNLGVQLGADPQTLLDVLSKGTAQSFGLEAITPSLLSRDFSIDGSPVMRLFLKDMNLVHQVATEAGAPIPTSEVTLELFERVRNAWPDVTNPAGVVLTLEQDNRGGQTPEP
jgi:3-hydroxyisobutyrate dehydrogenase-like beta-hydroxyacid dehydrogenase